MKEPVVSLCVCVPFARYLVCVQKKRHKRTKRKNIRRDKKKLKKGLKRKRAPGVFIPNRGTLIKRGMPHVLNLADLFCFNSYPKNQNYGSKGFFFFEKKLHYCWSDIHIFSHFFMMFVLMLLCIFINFF